MKTKTLIKLDGEWIFFCDCEVDEWSSASQIFCSARLCWVATMKSLAKINMRKRRFFHFHHFFRALVRSCECRDSSQIVSPFLSCRKIYVRISRNENTQKILLHNSQDNIKGKGSFFSLLNDMCCWMTKWKPKMFTFHVSQFVDSHHSFPLQTHVASSSASSSCRANPVKANSRDKNEKFTAEWWATFRSMLNTFDAQCRARWWYPQNLYTLKLLSQY